MSNNIGNTNQNLKMSAMSITSLVLGIIALVTSFVPIVNNASAIMAVLGTVFGVVGLIGIFKGKKKSKVFGIIAIALNILAFIFVIASQSALSNSLNDSIGNPAKSAKGASEASIGEALTFDNDLEITVQRVEQGLMSSNGEAHCKIDVVYKNQGNKEVSYNSFDWKVENTSGAQTSNTMFMDSNYKSFSSTLNNGKLAPNGTVSGTLYFKGDAAKVLYSSNSFAQTSGTWNVK